MKSQKIKLREVCVKYKTSKRGNIVKIDSPETAVACFHKIVEDDSQEHFMVIFTDIANQVIGYSVIGKGSDTETVGSTKIAFQKALLVCAANMVIMHNHPSNCVDPSESDRNLTRSFVRAGQLLEIQVVDHIVVGNDHYYSLRAHETHLFELEV